MNGFDGHVAELHDQPSSLRNFDAEIGLLGDLLANNQLIDPAADLCRPLDFSVPLHGKVFGQMVIEIAAGRKVDAITLAPYFQDDPDWSRTYSILAAASLNAGTRARTKALLQQVTILSSRRRLVAGLQDVIHAARDLTIEPAQLISDADEVVAEIAGGDDEVTQAPVGDYAQLVIDSFGKPVIGVRSGVIGSLDDLMGVLRPTNFVVTGGRPGMGKTLAVTNYARGAAERGHGVMLFSLEMSADELTRRILAEMCHSIEGGILYEHVRDGTVSANEIERVRQAKERLDALPFEICDRSGLTLASLVRRVRSHKRRLAARNQKLELVIVDYLQLMAPSRPGMSMYEHASEVSRGLKVLAKDEDLVVMAVAQLILDAQMASAVASNASSITSLASSLVTLTSAVLKFQSIHPEAVFAVIGAAAGSRFGPWGAAIGAVGGVMAGHEARVGADEQNGDLRFRAQRLREAKASYDLLVRDPNYRRGVANPTIDHARDALMHQMDLTKRAVALAKSPKKPEGGLGSDEAGDHNPDISHHKKGKSAEQLAREAEAKRQRALAEDSAFDRELRSAQVAYQHAEAALADTAQNQLRAELASLQDALITRRDEIDNQLSAGKISKVRRDQLVAILDATEADQEELARRKERSRLLSEKLAHDQLEVSGQIEMLGLDERLAYTRKERLKIELKILELQEQQALREQQKIIDDPTSTAAQRQDAQTRQGQVKDQYGKAQEDTRRQNASPLDSYKDQLKRDVGDMNDALQSVEVDGIKGIQDGLIGIINGTESVGSAFKKMADQIIADLIRIAAEKLILSVLDNIAGLAGGGSVGDGSHDISNGAKGFADGGIPGYAGGARVIKGAGSGTSDSILALLGGRKLIRVSNGESINTAESTRRNWALIDAMNQGPLPGFASGGMPSAPRAPSLPNIAGMGGGGAIQFNMPISINAPGADPAALKRVEDSVDQLRSEVPATAIQAVAEAKSRFMFRDGL